MLLQDLFISIKKKTIGKNQVAVPTHLYKIIVDPHTDEAIAFVLPNMSFNPKDLPNYIVQIRDIEDLTGLDFLSALDKQKQDSIEIKKADGLWQ
ncbi:MAG: DNA/RNA non-specific endonuclease [Chlorobium sp.]|nr:DNA/RNA non-specific endonuclease [Chlorobium sp.]